MSRRCPMCGRAFTRFCDAQGGSHPLTEPGYPPSTRFCVYCGLAFSYHAKVRRLVEFAEKCANVPHGVSLIWVPVAAQKALGRRKR